VSVPQLAPGRYQVKWRVLSVDTHVTEGDYSFDVAR
jgi:methionine-rich copper-binding protein CopC